MVKRTQQKKTTQAKNKKFSIVGLSSAKIRAAYKKIQRIIQCTSLERSNGLSSQFEANVFIKHEEQQHCGAFKLRGVSNHLQSLTAQQKKRGVITASTGNHGVALAYAAKALNANATIYLCDNVPQNKVDKIRGYGASVKFVKGWCLEAQNAAFADAKKQKLYYVPPYNSTITLCGAGTIGLEIWDQMANLNQKIDAVFACVGGGGLLSGVSTYLKEKDPSIQFFACSARKTPAMYECLKAGKIIQIPPTEPSVADGNGGNLESDTITFDIFQQNIEEVILVEEEDIKQATRAFVEKERCIVEPTAAVALAGYIKTWRRFRGKNIVVISCGRNVDFDRLQTILAETEPKKAKGKSRKTE